MKRLFTTFIVVFLILPTVILAQNDSEFSNEQLTLRTDLLNFLKEEGFIPEIDSDGDIKFKAEGLTNYIRVSNKDENPMFVYLFRDFNRPEEYSMETLVLATRELNFYKGVKVLCYDGYVRVAAEMFVRNAEPLKAVFYRLMGLIDNVKSDMLEECKKVASNSSMQNIAGIPFLVTNLEVANTDYDGNIIQDYGSSIYDYKTRYLKPRLTIRPFQNSGTYTVYVKFFKNGTLTTSASSPAGYSYSATITLSEQSSKVFTLSGWGSNNSGHWSAGDYRFEIWYGDYCLGSKSFKVI